MAVGTDSGLVGPTEKIRPWLRWSKGLEISGGTSTFFCTRRRVIKAGLSRASISARGNGTITPSRSSSGVKRSGAACRNSPKGILTLPRESCARTFSSGTQIVRAPASGILETRLQFQREPGEDGLHGQFEPTTVLMDAVGRVLALRQWGHHDLAPGRGSGGGRWRGLIFIGCLNPLSQKILYVTEHLDFHGVARCAPLSTVVPTRRKSRHPKG